VAAAVYAVTGAAVRDVLAEVLCAAARTDDDGLLVGVRSCSQGNA
jgi:hypothetical protein